MSYFETRTRAAEYVKGTVLFSKLDLPLIMTITPESFGGCSVSIATGVSSEDIELQRAKFFSETQVST